MDIPVYNMAGEEVARRAVDATALGGEPNLELVRQSLLMYEANRRVGTASIRRISEVRGTSRKPFRQKHTGRARQGDKRSPIHVGGGRAHGPKPRSFRQKLSKAMRRRALQSAFLTKVCDGQICVLDRLELPELKTKAMAAVLENLGARRTCLIVIDQRNADWWRCTRNIPGASMTTYANLNTYDLIRPRQVVFVGEAVERFLEKVTGPVAMQAGVESDE